MALLLFWSIFAALFGWYLIVRPALVISLNPQRDVLRIKRDFEGQGRVVTDVQRTGTDGGPHLYSPVYRRYAVTVQRQDGVTGAFTVGVKFGLASDAELNEHDPKARKTFFKGAPETF